jgi:hypothetical protein
MDAPDFNNSVDVMQTEGTEAITSTVTPDFANSVDVATQPQPVKPQRDSMISKVARFVFGGSQIEQFKTSLYLQDKLPDIEEGESLDSYSKKVDAVLKPREKEIIGEGIGKVMETPFQMLVAAGAVAAPVETALFVGGYALKDKFINLRRFTDKNFPNTMPEIKDLIEIADFSLTAGILGKGISWGKGFVSNRLESLGTPKNVNIKAEEIGKLQDSGNLLPEEKADMMKTLGINQDQVDASLNSGLPVNIPTDKVLDLAQKPYWERTKAELIEPEVARENIPAVDIQPILKNIKGLQKEKNLSNMTVSKLKQTIGIENIKGADLPKLEKLQTFLGDLKEGDKFLSEKQLAGLKDIIKDLPNPEITPKRIVIEKFGEQDDIFETGATSKVMPELLPTVDIKEGHPLIKRIVEKASAKLTEAENIISERNKKLDKMLTEAEKSREPLLSLGEKLKRKVTPQNTEIFRALSGERIELTKEEAGVVAYLKNFFAKAKEELKLEKYRKNYITHIEQTLTEKILDKGLFNAIKDALGGQKKTDVPIDIMLELDNIIGSEKFFKYALERKGGIEPTTNIRRIINNYSSLLETKKALDQILPEGQAITKNLLQRKSALWMKRFLQNLKGRGLDYNFRNGPMGWLSKVADGAIDLGYTKLLGLNYKSALKNIVAGEANSWIYQDFETYLKGKQRFYSDPKKAYQLATEYGALEGTYADFAQKGIGKLKKLQDLSMIGQKAGEVEIRSSIFASMLSDKEWETGVISPEKYNQIKDTIAITQGVFSKVDSPLWLQTWYGRMFFQMNRWRITNAMLLRRITTSASEDIKAGNYNTQNTTRLGKAIVAYGAGMYISYQLAQTGLKTASDVTRNMAQTIDGIVSLFTEEQLAKMFTDNPTLSVFKQTFATIANTAHYLNVPGSRKSREKGIEKTYIAPIENIEEAVNALPF